MSIQQSIKINGMPAICWYYFQAAAYYIIMTARRIARFMKRFVSYLYSIYNNQKIHNAGFARIELRTGRNRVDIHLKENGYAGKTGTVYLFIRKQKNIQGISIGNIIFRGNQADFRFEQADENIGQTPWQIAQMNGILVVVDERPAFLSQWDEQPVDTEKFEIWNAQEKEEQQISSPEPEKESAHQPDLNNNKDNNKDIKSAKEYEQNKKNMAQKPIAENHIINNTGKEDVKQKKENESEDDPEKKSDHAEQNKAEYKKESRAGDKIADAAVKRPETMPVIQQEHMKEEDKAKPSGNVQTAELQAQPVNTWMQTWRYMLKTYPVLNQFTDKNNVLCVRIEIKDVRLLPEKYWSMINNSFLLHGFFNYRYLVFGRVDQNWFIGVPGVYQKQEHVMASVFGFPDFLPQKEKNDKGEQPGYWYRILDMHEF